MNAPSISLSVPAVRSQDLNYKLALFLVLVVGLFVRLHSIRFGLPALNDPDELTFELGALKMLRGPTLNPGWFGHPATTTMYVLALVTVAVFAIGHLLGQFPTVGSFADAIYADPTWVMLPGRLAMALFAVAMICLAYRLACELFDRRTALIAAALLAVSPVQITWSQVIRSDMMACFFMLLCMLAALRIARKDRWRDHVLAALWLAAASATKWPYAITALALFGVAILRMKTHSAERRRSAMRLALCAVLALGFLLLISPYLLLDHETAFHQIRGEAQIRHLGATGGTIWENAWWYLTNPLLTGLGLVGLGLAGLGLAIMGRQREALAIVLPVVAGFFLLLCAQNLVWERWALALVTLLAIAAAKALTTLGDLLSRHLPRQLAIGATVALIALTLFQPALRARADAQARLNDTRQLASAWARANVPAGSTVLLEHFAFDLQPQPWHFLFPLGDAGCIDAKEMLHGKVQLHAVDARRGNRSNVDYGTVAPAMRGTCATDYAILTQYDRYAAERRAFPEQYTAYRELLSRGQLVATFAPEYGKVGGPVTRIVRFRRD